MHEALEYLKAREFSFVDGAGIKAPPSLWMSKKDWEVVSLLTEQYGFTLLSYDVSVHD